jgi:hypothetical protein
MDSVESPLEQKDAVAKASTTNTIKKSGLNFWYIVVALFPLIITIGFYLFVVQERIVSGHWPFYPPDDYYSNTQIYEYSTFEKVFSSITFPLALVVLYSIGLYPMFIVYFLPVLWGFLTWKQYKIKYSKKKLIIFSVLFWLGWAVYLTIPMDAGGFYTWFMD